MAKYLFQASYTNEGVRGLLKEGASSRKVQLAQLAAEMGGSLEVFYFAFGDDDVYGIVDLPDHETTAALALIINASGAVKVKTIVLMTAEQVDRATKMTANFLPTGK